ncbi:hypothetical protein BDF14DRAFT_1856817 [Spinellus fusiger]|nr:hypothetical protein BDF14DRAFT_1856817 [Spinellus fusiger]
MCLFVYLHAFSFIYISIYLFICFDSNELNNTNHCPLWVARDGLECNKRKNGHLAAIVVSPCCIGTVWMMDLKDFVLLFVVLTQHFAPLLLTSISCIG